ncbi:MAG TPA: zinc-finger domain-containing protein [Ureibacillus sp.]|nr:zinc-finger domain-containing protein [Ureibacillus sp.]
MNKNTVIKDIDEITDTYCNDCPIKRELRGSRGKSGAHRFCIEQCSVGAQLRFLGNELMKIYEK